MCTTSTRCVGVRARPSPAARPPPSAASAPTASPTSCWRHSGIYLQPPHTVTDLVRLEVVCSDPVLYLFHDILGAAEISYMKKNVLNLLAVATVVDERVPESPGKRYSNVRTQSVAWLSDHDHELLYKLSKKVSLMTGLETFRPRIDGKIDKKLIEAEPWQLGLYGSGGHILPHFDPYPPDNLPSDAWNEGVWVGTRLIFSFTSIPYQGF